MTQEAGFYSNSLRKKTLLQDKPKISRMVTVSPSIPKEHNKKLFRNKYIIACLLLLLCTAGKIIAQPSISSFSPASGPVGAVVTITGVGFSANAADNIVFFGSSRANVTAATTTNLTVSVPAGASFQPITVTSNRLTAYAAVPFIVTFSGGGRFGQESIDFTAAVDSVPNTIFETADLDLTDFDGDGSADVVVVDGVNNKLSIYKNTSSDRITSFSTRQDFETALHPNYITTGDLDGDGRPDVVVSNNETYAVSVFKNISTPGSISFAPRMDFATRGGGTDISIRDLDSDGRPDVAVLGIDFDSINGLRPLVSILRNNSSAGVISFEPQIDISMGFTVGRMCIGNLDNDLRPEIVVDAYASNRLLVLKNNSTPGSISFSAGPILLTGNTPVALTIGDVDMDGKQDLASANINSSTVSLFRNVSSGGSLAFATRIDRYAGEKVSDIEISDLDGDGKPDLAIANLQEAISIFRNISNPGSFSFAPTVTYQGYGEDFSIADVNNDGQPDLAVTGGFRRVSIWENKIGYPVISSFSPATAAAGMTVTITGFNFSGTTAVSFGGVAATSFTVINATTIQAILGSGTSGEIKVTTPHGSGRVSGFTYVYPPTITGFTPVVGGQGTVVTISGTHFTTATAVTFGGVPAKTFTVKDAGTITATAASGASGNISVTTIAGEATAAGFTYISAPVINSFSPARAAEGETVTITGSHFINVTAVSFGGKPAAAYTVVSPTTITAVTGKGDIGDISVTTVYGSGSIGGFIFNYPPAPVISSLFPVAGPVGSTVTITGNHFNTNAANNIVFFGATRATVSSATATTLTVIVPAGSSHQLVSVLNIENNLTGYSKLPFNVTFPGGGNILENGFAQAGTAIEFSSDIRPSVLATGDIDGDGKADFLVGNHTSTSVLKNSSTNGNFSFTQKNYLNNFQVSQVRLADMDGDGKLDILGLTNGNRSDIFLQRNTSSTSTISFDAPLIIRRTTNTRHFATGDIDRDGKPDIILSNWGIDTISVLPNTSLAGSISFSEARNYYTAGQPDKITISDLDDDGKPEVIFTKTLPAGGLSILKNTSVPKSISFDARADRLPLEEYTNLLSGDLNKDGKPDVVLLKTSSFAVLRNTGSTGTISFAGKLDHSFLGRSRDINIGDLDGDGMPDLAIATDRYNVSVHKNTSAGDSILFAPSVEYSFGNNWTVNISDLNGDAKPEISAAIGDWHTVVIRRNTVDAPYITSFSPASGKAGEKVYIKGVNFTGASSVYIGSLPVSSFTVDSATGITAILRSGNDGNITVTTPRGSDVSKTPFMFIYPFSIISFSPANARTGTLVSIFGHQFDSVKTVKFGGVPAVSFAIDDSRHISAVVGEGASGSITLIRTGDSLSIPGFRFYKQPVITSFTPAITGWVGTITIKGANFTGATQVKVNSSSYSFKVLSDTVITLESPRNSGTITVTTPGGTASMDGLLVITSNMLFTFSPVKGGPGTVVTITGADLNYVDRVSFGGVPARSFIVHSEKTITAVVGEGASGEVRVGNVAGEQSQQGFIFTRIPIVTSFDPAIAGPGTMITIHGANLDNVKAVKFGGVAAASFNVISTNLVTAVVGTGASGNVTITNGTDTTALGGFTYTEAPYLLSLSPAIGGPGTEVTLTGLNLSGISSVKFGAVAAKSFTINSSTSIAAKPADGDTGVITISGSKGTALIQGFTFTRKPVIHSFSPSSGPAGALVKISGANFSPVASENSVYFGAVKATVQAASANMLFVKAPAGATFHPISVTKGKLSGYTSESFIITYPAYGNINVASFQRIDSVTKIKPSFVSIADLNEDGKPELVVASGENSYVNNSSLFKNTSTAGKLSFAKPDDFLIGSGSNSIAFDDLNGDGKLDLVYGLKDDANAALALVNNRTNEKISFLSSPPLKGGLAGGDVCVSDFDGDGRPDIAGSSYWSNAIYFFRNTGINGELSFATRSNVQLSHPDKIYAADVDSDGKPDLVVTTFEGVISILKNTSTTGVFSFETKLLMRTQKENPAVALGDLDGDGKPDIVVSASYLNSISVFRNISSVGSIDFGERKDFFTGAGPDHIAIGDLDGDRRPDIAVANSRANSISVFNNSSTRGAISFLQKVDFATEKVPIAVAIGDLDADDKPELVVANSESSSVSIFKNLIKEATRLQACINEPKPISAGLTGTSYQWQVKINGSFQSITDGAIYGGTDKSDLQIKNSSSALNGNQYRCLVDNNISATFALTVHNLIHPTGTITAANEVCLNEPVNVGFVASDVPEAATVQLWESVNGGNFSAAETKGYINMPLAFQVNRNDIAGKNKYFFKIIPPEVNSCSLAGYSDTVSTDVLDVSKPVLELGNATLTVLNPDSSLTYRWQVLDVTNTWKDLEPSATGITYKFSETGSYRVMAKKGSCAQASDARIVVISALPPMPAAELGIRLHPNPTSSILHILSLKLSDNWQTLEIMGNDGTRKPGVFNIKNKTNVTLQLDALSPGVYFVLLKRKQGRDAIIKFIKM